MNQSQPQSDPPIIPSIAQLPQLPQLGTTHSNIGPLTTTNSPLLAIEQPCMNQTLCFVCGCPLADEKTSFASSDLLAGCCASFLDVLGAALGIGLATDKQPIEACEKCTKLTRCVDSAFQTLYDLRRELSRLFHGNNRPKMTLQLIPKTTNTPTTTTSAINLDDLAATRSRRGRRKTTTTTTTATTTTTTATVVKKKGGRPRKPYPCGVCRRKFLTPRAAQNHMNRDHNTSTTTTITATTTPNTTIIPAPTTITATPTQVKTEYREITLKSEPPLPPPPPLPQPLPPPQLPQPKQSTSQVLNSLRPIQPKPQAVRTQGSDGSVVVVVNSNDSTTALISMTPDYPGVKTHTNTHMYACDTCGKAFMDEKSKRMHKIAAHGKRTHKQQDGVHTCAFVCKTCGVSFKTRRELGVHKRVHTVGSEKYTCTHCKSAFMYKYELNRHMETHMPYIQTNAHEFVCRLCGLHVASRAALKIHVHRFHARAHDAENTHTDAHTATNHFLCASCGHLARTRKAFMDHQRIHNPQQSAHEKTVTCKLCHKNMLGSSLRTHERRMHGEAAYICASCGDKFCVRSDLMRHLNAHHSGLKPYMCTHESCSQAFTTSDALRYHRNKVHSTATHTCTYCPKTYKWKGELRTHIQRVHTHSRERFSCSVCSRSYADRRKLRHHLSVKHGEDNINKQQQHHEENTTTTTFDPQQQQQQQPQQDQEQSIVAIPIYQNSTTSMLHATTNIAVQEIDSGQIDGTETISASMEDGEIYLVPNLSIPIHEEQVSTS